MGQFVKGEVVVISFPFTDFSNSIRRPALVVASPNRSDPIFCMITRKRREDGFSIPLEPTDFDQGRLDCSSNIRPNRIFTAAESKVISSVGKVKQAKIQEVIGKLVQIIQS